MNLSEIRMIYDLDPSVNVDEHFVLEIVREQIHLISLKHCGLTDDHTDYMIQLIKNSSLTKIDISFNSLSVHAIDRLLNVLDAPPHRVIEFEIDGMGTKHQRDRLRLLLARNRKFNAQCDTHRLLLSAATEAVEEICCVACAHAEMIRKFQNDISALKMSLEDKVKMTNKLKSTVEEADAYKEQADRVSTAQIAELMRQVAELNGLITRLTKDKDTAVSGGQRLAEVVEELKKREISLQADLKTERQHYRETRKAFEKERDDFDEKIHKLDEDVYDRQEDLTAVRRTASEIELQLRKEIAENFAKAADLSKQIAELTTSKTRDSDVHMVQIRALVTENMSLSETADRMRRALTESQGDLEAAEGRARHQETDIARLRQSNADKDNKLLEISDENEKLKTDLRNERVLWSERLRGMEAEMHDECLRRDSASRETLQVLRGSLARVTELLD